MTRYALFSLMLSAAVAAQESAIEVVGPAREPGEALREQVGKGEDELLLFDVCYGVRQSVLRVHDVWREVELTRARGMRALLLAMQQRCRRGNDAATKECADVAAVATALLDPSGERATLTPAQRDELRDVEAGTEGSQRFLPAPVATDWCVAQPIGAYARDEAYAPLYRATVYVRWYREAWPRATRAAWQECAEASRSGDAAELTRAEQAWSILFGTALDASGVGKAVVSPDRAWLLIHKDDTASAGGKLAGLFAAVRMPAPVATSDGVLRLCHELAIARAADPLFAAMPSLQWQAKWSDAAAFAYVGLREVDGLAFGPGIVTAPPAPAVVVEPLPAVWEAVEWLQRRCDAAHDAVFPRAADAPSRRPWIADVVEALRLQQNGEDVPPALNERLQQHLLTAFGGADDGLGTAMRIEGIGGSLRRAVPQLVRVPIVWRGQTKKSLALRLFVEQQGAEGRWQAAR